MGFITKAFSGLLGGGSPTASTGAITEIAEDEKKKKRSALYATQGGVSGEEVMSVSPSGRSTLYGN